MKGRVTFSWVKKALLTAIASVSLFTTNSYAQFLHLGVTGGPQLTNLQSDLGNFKGVVGFNGGLAADWRITNNFGLELDVLLSQNGASKTYLQPNVNLGNRSINYYTYKTTDQLSYLQVVLLPKFIIPLGSKPIIPYDKPGDQKMHLAFYAGPYFGYLAAFNSAGKISGYTVMSDLDTVNKFDPIPYTSTGKDVSYVSPIDFGFTAGAGINFNLAGGKTILGFDGRYSRGLNSIDYGYYSFKTLGVNAANQPVLKTQAARIYNTALAFNVSLKFRLLGD
jgi:hypothetical protein